MEGEEFFEEKKLSFSAPNTEILIMPREELKNYQRRKTQDQHWGSSEKKTIKSI